MELRSSDTKASPPGSGFFCWSEAATNMVEKSIPHTPRGVVRESLVELLFFEIRNSKFQAGMKLRICNYSRSPFIDFMTFFQESSGQMSFMVE